MTKPSLILGVAAAFVLSILPLAASAGASHSGYRPAQWQRAHDGQGVLRVYNSDAYRAPETYTGGEFRGGLDVQTTSEVDYQENRYETSDRYGPARPESCRSACVTAYAPPPPPPCVTQGHREVHYAEPRVVSRQVVVHEEDSPEESYEYRRESSRDHGYRRHHVRHDDCPCRSDDHYRHEDADDRYDDRYDDRRDDQYEGYGRDVFGRY